MNELRSFSNEEFGELNILEIDGKPYFPATQCARTVGHENPARAVRKFCKGVTQMVTPTEGCNQTVNFIPEGDLYRLIVHSRLPAAERFEKWVFEEVLPSIRQSGGYAPDMAQMIREEVRHAMQEAMDEIIRSAEMDAGVSAEEGMEARAESSLIWMHRSGRRST